MRIIHEPSASKVAYCGFAVDAGTRDELENEQGMAHFVEHLIFKGTAKRKAWHILNRMVIARPNQCAQGNINRLRRADCHHDFGLGVIVGVEALGEVLADFPAQFRQTAVARVLRAAVDDGVDGGVADVIRGDKIGFAHAKGDGVTCGEMPGNNFRIAMFRSSR